jgi:Ca2+-binding EF-hand superfamily protein
MEKSVDEPANGTARKGQDIEKEKLKAQKYIKTVFAEIDVDQSGQICFDEFQFWWLLRRNEHREFLHKHDADELQDKDHDVCPDTEKDKDHDVCPDTENFIDTDREQLNQIQLVFDIADTNFSGTISFDEFAAAFTKLLAEGVEAASWQEQWDEMHGTKYFYNTATQESSWTVPNQEAIKFPPTHEGVQEIVMGERHRKCIDIWKVDQRQQGKNTRRLILDFVLYIFYFIILIYFLVKVLPLPTASLKMHEALADFLLDEEFSEDQVLNHKKSHGDVATIGELWQWVDGPLFGAIYGDGDSEDRSPQPLLGVTHLMGAIQIRQARVQNGFCTEDAVKFFDELKGPGRGVPGGANTQNYTDDDYWCTGHWDDERGLSSPLVVGAPHTGGQYEWIKHWGHTERSFESDLKGSTTFVHAASGFLPTGIAMENTGSNGFGVTLPRDREEWLEMVAELQEHNFIDEYTRLVAFEFNLYNANDADTDDHSELDTDQDEDLEDMVVILRLGFSQNQVGHIEHTNRMEAFLPMRSFFYLDSSQKKNVFYLWVFTGVLVYGLLLMEMFYDGFHEYFFRSGLAGWHWFDLITMIAMVNMFINVFAFHEDSLDVLDTLFEPVPPTCCPMTEHRAAAASDVFTDLWFYRKSFKTMMRATALFSFLTVCKLFKYMTLDRRFYFMIRVMDTSKSMLAVFLLIFLILIVAFAFMTMFLFGFKSRDFHNIVSAICTMFQVSLGEPLALERILATVRCCVRSYFATVCRPLRF